jgi:TolB-like protein/Tfp pilus assembly protein PilF
VAVLTGIGVIAVGLIVAFLASRSRERQAPTVVADPVVLTIAVQPFDNISGRSEDDYLSDGLLDELTAALARISSLSVAPRSSAIKFRRVPSRTMGESLHVAWVLEGTLNHVGSQLRVRPTLVDVKRGRVAWSEPYDRELRDIVSVQREIVKAIADTLRLTLLPQQARPLNRPPENIDAYINYLKGRSYWNQRTPNALDSAITYFNTALKYDSNYALAYSGLADVYSLRGWAGVAPRKTFPLALKAARRAIALDSNVAAAHASLGFVHIWYDWDWAAGQREIDRAIAMDSTYASAVLFTAFYLIPRGRMHEAVLAAQHAQRLEPLSPIINARVGSILAYSHRFPEADSALRQTLKNNPGFPIAKAQLARLLAIEGRFPEAIAALPPDDGSLGSFEAGVRGFVYARAGDRANAFKQIRALESRSYKSPDAIAAIYAGLGDADQAFAWLEQAYEARAYTFVLLAVEPMYDGLHADPRFKQLLARIHSVAPET